MSVPLEPLAVKALLVYKRTREHIATCSQCRSGLALGCMEQVRGAEEFERLLS